MNERIIFRWRTKGDQHEETGTAFPLLTSALIRVVTRDQD